MPVLKQKMSADDFASAMADSNLSMKQRGILATLQAMPLDIEFTLEDIAESVTDGYPSILSGVRALELSGYLDRVRLRDAGGHVKGSEYRLYRDVDLQ